MTKKKLQGWDAVAAEVRPFLDDLLVIYIEKLIDLGHPPPVVHWVITTPTGTELDSSWHCGWGSDPLPPGKATRYTTRDTAERTLESLKRHANAHLTHNIDEVHASRVIPVVEIRGTP